MAGSNAGCEAMKSRTVLFKLQCGSGHVFEMKLRADPSLGSCGSCALMLGRENWAPELNPSL